MNRKSLLVGILAFIGLTATAAFLVRAIATWLRSLDTPIVAALITAAIGLLGLWYAQWQSKSRDISESHRASKIAVYSTFFSIVEKFQSNEISSEELASKLLPEALKNDITSLNRGLILWASPEVITAWLNFKVIASSGGNVMLAMDKMYMAIRKDLGNKTFGLSPSRAQRSHRAEDLEILECYSR